MMKEEAMMMMMKRHGGGLGKAMKTCKAGLAVCGGMVGKMTQRLPPECQRAHTQPLSRGP